MNAVKRPLSECWLKYEKINDAGFAAEYGALFGAITAPETSPVIRSAVLELKRGVRELLGKRSRESLAFEGRRSVVLGTFDGCRIVRDAVTAEERREAGTEGFVLKTADSPDGPFLVVGGGSDRGVLYGVHELIRRMRTGKRLGTVVSKPASPLRIIDHWDNMDGKIERGYAGDSIIFERNAITRNTGRIRDYARLLSSVGINGITINNVNVRERETLLITRDYLPHVARLADVFGEYGIALYLSVNYASPIRLSGLSTSDPLDPGVRRWWKEKAAEIYAAVPRFGGFLVKADSEYNPGPYAYGRDHADGANMLAEALAPFGGLVIWRCFVYNCRQDWRDRVTDRARAACDTFMPLDGRFLDNVVLQTKNGPMDFQIREPISPLFGRMERTNQCLELQITQEYTGQQIHLCYLVPMWKEALDFDTYARGKGSTVARIVSGEAFGTKTGGIAGVGNVGDGEHLTGHPLAQANLYGFGRLAWDPTLSSEAIADEWILQTFGSEPSVVSTIRAMLLRSREVFENYTVPLGIGWMVNPGYHYGPSPEGYEYSLWGTYHRADTLAIGVDRTVAGGTGFTGQYHSPNRELYENFKTCPEELLLFFHRVPYSHVLSSGKTLLQHVYDAHFEGVLEAETFVTMWKSLEPHIADARFAEVLKRLEEQIVNAREWRDVVNSYFYRKSGIPDAHGRTIY